MDKKELQKLLDKQTVDIENRFKEHLGVLVENSDNQVKLIAEQHLSIMRVLEDADGLSEVLQDVPRD